jgi:hypothetical protein
MPTIPYSAAGFPPPFAALNGNGALTLPWSALLWAAITVGRAELLHVFRHGEFSLFEIAYRGAILFANLCDDGTGGVRRSEAYDGLDPSEKSAISYFMGLTLAKALAEDRLGVPWLMHLDVYRKELQPVFATSGKSRPDLVGQTAGGDWIAIESKGRTNAFDASALQTAKGQVQQLATIGGIEPVVRIGMVTHFSESQLQFTADDPPPGPDSERRIELPLTRDKLLEAYYRPFRTWLAEDPRAHDREIEGTTYRVAPVDAADVTVGVDRDVIAAELPQPKRRQPLAESEAHYAGSDGVIVIVGPLWSDENMRLEPQERTTPRRDAAAESNR